MKRILVTGANKGIGLAIARGLVKKGCFVFLGSRDVARGEEAKRAFSESEQKHIEVVQLDVTDSNSVTKAAVIVAAKCAHEPLFGLINNAGGSVDGAYTTHADFEEILELNFGGVVRVTSAFLPLLANDGRIVMVSSGAAPSYVAKLSKERQKMFLTVETGTEVTLVQIRAFLNECRAISASSGANVATCLAAFEAAGFGNGDPYGLSKACVNAYTTAIARENPSMKINACSPGFIETDLTRSLSDKMGLSLAALGAKSADEGSVAPLYLMLDAVAGSGWYFGSDARRSPPHLYREPGTVEYKGDGKFDAATTSKLFEEDRVLTSTQAKL